MKKSLLAIAVAAALPVAAQAQVTLSGSISTGIIDSGAPGAKAKVGKFGGGGNSISVNAVDNIGGGLKAGFTSQMRFDPISGDEASDGGTAIGNKDGIVTSNLFHTANVYLSGGFGTVSVGKIAEASSCAFDPFMCTTGAGSLYTGVAGYIVGASTQNNSISYRSPSISGFSGGLQTTVNRDGEDRQNIDLNYSAGPITAQYMLVNGNTAHSSAGVTGTKATDQLIGIKYDAKVVAVSFVNTQKENAAGTKTANINYLAALIPMGSFSIAAAYSTDSKAADASDTAWAVGVNYPMGKRTLLGFDLFEKEVAGGSTGFAARIRHTF
jgi:predicted porin